MRELVHKKTDWGQTKKKEDKENMKVGILGAGSIAVTMAKTLNGMENARAYAVGSRSLEKAQAFAEKNQVEKAYGSYEALFADPEVELIYVAVPHSHHCQAMKMALEAGKPVLCEKAFTANAAQAEEILRLSEEKGIFVGEAMWTRFLPSRAMIDEVIRSGEIGKVHMITANLGYDIRTVERLRNPELAGGALLDVGIYPLTFIRMITDAKRAISEYTSCVSWKPAWMRRMRQHLYLKTECMASMHSSMLGGTEQAGIVYGDQGYLIAWNINNVNKIQIFDNNRKLIREMQVPEQITGFEYEVQAAIEAISAGKTECPQMPHSETMYMMRLMDRMREAWGIRFPFETK